MISKFRVNSVSSAEFFRKKFSFVVPRSSFVNLGAKVRDRVCKS